MKKKISAPMIAVVSVGMLSVAASALAARASMLDYTYYSDATHSTYVGEKIYMCNNTVYQQGQVTQYYELETMSCSPYP